MKNTGLDSKQSWLVAIAGSTVFLLTTWPMRLGSQLFVFMIERYDTTRKAASFPFSLSYFMRSISGPIVGFFGEKFGLQQVTLFGCMLCALGVGGCFFAESIITVNICLGIIFGTGFGLSTLIVPEIINLHFDQHRAKANGIVFAGGGLGAFITPPIIEWILNDYGVSETFLIMCAILLNGIPAALLMSVPKAKKEILEVKPRETFENIKSVRASQDVSPYYYLQDDVLYMRDTQRTNKDISVAEFTEHRLSTGHYNPFMSIEIILNDENEIVSKICKKSELTPNADFKILHSSPTLKTEMILNYKNENREKFYKESELALNDTEFKIVRNNNAVLAKKMILNDKNENVSKICKESELRSTEFETDRNNPILSTEILNRKNESESKNYKKDADYNSRNPDFETVNESKLTISEVFFPNKIPITKSNFLELSRQCRRLTPVLIDVRGLRKQSLPGFTDSLQRLNEIELPSTSTFASCSVLWDPIFLTLTLIQSLSLYVMYIFWTITVDIVRDKGVGRSLEVYFVMSQSLFDMIGTATLGIIPDSGYMTQGNFCAFCFASMGLSCILLIYVSGFWPTIVGISILSAVLGGNVTGLPGTITQFIDEDKRGMAMASRFIMYAPMSFTMSPLIGYFRGTLGSYDGLMYTLTGMCTLCTFLLLILPRLIKLRSKRNGLEIK